MDNLFNTILTNTTSDLTVATAAVTMLISLLLGDAVAFTYYKTQDETAYQRNFAITLFMLPVILSVIIIFVGSNVARAFSLAGTLSIIRFRSAPGDTKDIGFIFFDIAAGVAVGSGLYGYGVLFVIVLCAALVIFEKAGVLKPKYSAEVLKITIPEDLNYKDAFEDILNKYTAKHAMSKIKTTDLGSLFEVSYDVCIDKDVNRQEFINELRCRNGNLTIMLSEAPKIVK